MSHRNIQKPCSVQMAITYRCNLRCTHCDIWKSEKKEELKTNQWLKIIGSLRKWLGPFRLDISGGEPFLRRDMLDIIDFCDKNQVKTVVTTNATLLNLELISTLSHIKSLTLNISIDGINPSTHDYLRNSEGVHQKAMEALLEFKKNNKECYITMATILMGYNIEEVMPLIKRLIVDRLADDINFQALDHNFHAPYRSAWFKENELWPSEDKKESFISIIDGIIRIKKAGTPICNSLEQLIAMRNYFNSPDQILKTECNTGDVNFIINPNGDVHLCWNMPPIGNILSLNPEKIWQSVLTQKRRKQISKCTRTCRILNCNFNETLMQEKI